jgi:urease accessory protein
MTDRLRIFTQRLPARGASPDAVLHGATAPATLRLVLPFEQRRKARQRARIAPGFEVGIQLPRGTVLRGGDLLRASDGTTLEIVAAHEPVSTVWSRNLRRLAQVAYHLGNRHVALEIGTGWVRYLADHVLDAMVVQLGLTVIHHDEPFEPEAGAYGGHEHAHAAQPPHAHAHAAHPHAHRHDPDHDHHALPHEQRLIFGGVHRHPHDHEQ